MKTFALLACSTAVFAFASAASAGPLAGAVSKGITAADIGLIEPVHGCHREVAPDRWGWHFHRRNCGRVNVRSPDYGPDGPGFYGPYEPYRSPCYWVGPVRVCP